MSPSPSPCGDSTDRYTSPRRAPSLPPPPSELRLHAEHQPLRPHAELRLRSSASNLLSAGAPPSPARASHPQQAMPSHRSRMPPELRLCPMELRLRVQLRPLCSRTKLSLHPRRGTGMGRWGTSPPPLHPTGLSFILLSPQWGEESPQFHPLMDKFPNGDRRIGDRARCHS